MGVFLLSGTIRFSRLNSYILSSALHLAVLQWPSLLLKNGVRNQDFVIDVLIFIGILFLGSQLTEQVNINVCTRGSGNFIWAWVFLLFHIDSILGQKFPSYLQGSCGNSGT